MLIPELCFERIKAFSIKHKEILTPYYGEFVLDTFNRFVMDTDDLIECVIASYYTICTEIDELVDLDIFFINLEREANEHRSCYDGCHMLNRKSS